MIHGDLLRSTPMRLTARLIGVFALAMLLSFGAAFWVMRGSLDADLRAQLRQEMQDYAEAESAADLGGKIAEAVTEIDPGAELLVWQAPSGARTGNVAGLPAAGGFSLVPAARIALPPGVLADSYLVLSAPVQGGVLTIGRSRERVTELGETFALVFLLGMLPTLALAATLGGWSAWRARDRVDAIRDTLRRLSAGALEARVPEPDRTDDDLAQIGHAVNRMAAAQAAATASLRQVSADIAHDLKTPIQRVSVLLERLDRLGPLTEPQRAVMDSAQDQTEQIVQTFQSLLQIAQIEGGGAEAHFAAVDLAAVVEGIVDLYRPSVEETGHALTLTLPSAPCIVTGERNLLGQIVANLIENASRHTAPGSRIDIALAGDGRGVRLEVADSGEGIPADERQNVLRRLYRLERSRTSEGSGLGLSLVAAIAEVHGATLTLDDNAPGLAVRVAFPPAAAAPRGAVKAIAQP